MTAPGYSGRTAPMRLAQPWLHGFKPNEFEESRAKYYRVDPAVKASSGRR